MAGAVVLVPVARERPVACGVREADAARYVDKILRGARPGDLPTQHPPEYDLTIHASAARKIDLRPPPSLLAQADRVLE